MSVKMPKKLIEVALPLDDINEAAAREKSIRHGHPSTLHLWWARRPLAAARAVLFAQMVNDPGGERGYYAGKTKQQANHEREKLFGIIRDLVKWENTNNEQVLSRARAEIRKSWRETCELNKGKPGFDPEVLPAFHDPFAGGGAIPLEAQRLGLESHASDLNPVAVLINKAMIEIPPRFAGRKPVGPIHGSNRQGDFAQDWSGAQGLAEDVQRYGALLRDEALKKIGHLYPRAHLDNLDGRHDGGDAMVIAWLWTRTVKCPNPACGINMPLLTSFVLSSRAGSETYLVPQVLDDGHVDFSISRTPPAGFADPSKGFKRGVSGIFECVSCGTTTTRNYTAEQATKVGLGYMPTAIVCDGRGGRFYLRPNAVDSPDLPEIDVSGLTAELSPNPRDVWCRNFGLNTAADLFTKRQLVALTTFSDLVQEVRSKVRADAMAAGWTDDSIALDAQGNGATAYADAVSVYLGLAVDKMTDYNSSLVVWSPTRDQLKTTFARQALPMAWDFAEANVFAGAAGDFEVSVAGICRVISSFQSNLAGYSSQANAQTQKISSDKVISTDPPYYDNIGYADLSDFFYVWARRSLRKVYPELFATISVPKADELIAAPYRHGNAAMAENFFLTGMTSALQRLSVQSHESFPITIYYAFKQSDTSNSGTGNTGWETFLEALVGAGFTITGTWPMRTERGVRSVGLGNNALASSIILVCRKRSGDAVAVSRKDYLRELRDVLPSALEDMLNGGEGRAPIAPVDLSQAVIGPGMAVFSKYRAVLEADGSPMSVHTAMTLINKFFDDGDDFDPDTRFCLGWFQQYGWATGQFGTADVLARSKGTHVDHVRDAGVVQSGEGKVRLFKVVEYPDDWNPETDKNMPVWESLHHIIKALSERGEDASGALLAKMPDKAEGIRQLAYRLYTLCERKGWADDARQYNTIITSWSSVEEASHRVGRVGTQATLDL